MAKISANGCCEIGRITCNKIIDGDDHREQWLLRSDGAVLRKVRVVYSEGKAEWTGWTVAGKMKTEVGVSRMVRLQAIVQRKGFVIEKVAIN